MASLDPVQVLSERFASAIAAAFPDAGALDPQITASKNPKFGDFQCNAAMALGKSLGRPPRDVAAAIVAKVDLRDLAEPLDERSIAGPGFINIMLRPAALAGLLAGLEREDLGLAAGVGAGRRVVVDLCGVNLAKQMHVGHIRSTVIGDTLARVLARLGWDVRRQNHVGDWGLPIAMVTARIMEAELAGRLDLARVTLDDLDTAYRAAKLEAEADRRGLEAARRWNMGPKALAELEAQVTGADEKAETARRTLVRLQAQDPEVMRVWRRISDVTMAECVAMCARLNAIVREEHSAGESAYAEELAGVVADFQAAGLAVESDGALVVHLEDRGIPEPLILRKRDGGYLYATTDLAAVRRRVRALGAERAVYAVDARQGLHFRQVFAAADKVGYTALPGGAGRASFEHAAFGTMLGEDGRPFKTRSGESVKLRDLLDDAQERALAAVRAREAGIPEAELTAIAQAVATAAIRYADLSTERIKDYVFSFDRMLAFEGNTGPYLLYALVRTRSIFRKAEAAGVDPRREAAEAALAVVEPAEKALALALLRYPGVVRAVGETLEPHRLCQYLYELAGAFSVFFDQCNVLYAKPPASRGARLRLCSLTARVLEDGLGLLGIPTLERM